MKISMLFLFLSSSFFGSIITEWETYTGKDNTFSIKFPGKPDVIEMGPNSGINRTQIIALMQIDELNPITNSYAYNLTIMDLSNEILKPNSTESQKSEVLERYSTVTIGLMGEILSTEKISISGFPGIYLKARMTQSVNDGNYPPVFMKSYLVENKIYQLRINCPPGKKEYPNIDQFFDSFELNLN